ncbi:uncharacterized protein LOC108954122 [Eucalyptus grandis]|uniref:uncharacterized protein LOC108954122 n=1 Tax=Eucalyptus grandis TaxID=71139 RepID=UPI00192E9EAF|nr:uncharacterized protein LOC108954122 [Eucalyptus grandis]
MAAIDFSSGVTILHQQLKARNLEKKLQKAGGLSSWLMSVGLGQFVRIFRCRRINEFQLANMTMKKLKDMGAAAVGPRRKLMLGFHESCIGKINIKNVVETNIYFIHDSLKAKAPKTMEETVAALGKRLDQSLDRRPIPLDSASSTFIQCLNRRVSTASGDLDLLDSMTFGTVLFEEGPHVDDVEEDTVDDLSSPLELDPNSPLSNDGFDRPSSCSGRLTAAVSMTKSFEEDSLFDDSISLKRLGISDVALATLASEVKGPKSVVKASKDEYESLPSYMKSLASWEDLLIAIEKINSYLSKKENCSENKSFFQDEISSLALGGYITSVVI